MIWSFGVTARGILAFWQLTIIVEVEMASSTQDVGA
jgi:hypothetical protein